MSQSKFKNIRVPVEPVAKVNGANTSIETIKTGLLAKKAEQADRSFAIKLEANDRANRAAYRAERAYQRATLKFERQEAKYLAEVADDLEGALMAETIEEKQDLLKSLLKRVPEKTVVEAKELNDRVEVRAALLLKGWLK